MKPFYSLETLPKPKVECVTLLFPYQHFKLQGAQQIIQSLVTGTFILIEDRYSHVLIMINEIILYSPHVLFIHGQIICLGRTALLVLNMHHSRIFRICYYHIFTISHNHLIHSSNVDVIIQSQSTYIKSVSFFKQLFFCHTNSQF